MSRRSPRPITGAEFLEAFRRVVRRLDNHLIAIDRGEYHLRDDLATVLRTIVARGKGDDALRRLLKRFNLNPPTCWVSPPATPGVGVMLSVGALPVDQGAHTVCKPIRVSVPDELMMANAVVALTTEGGIVSASWEKVVIDYGNTFGAHLSTTVPGILDDVHYYGLSETDFGTFMLRTLGVVISSSCHEVLSKLDPAHESVTHDHYMAGAHIIRAVYFRSDTTDELTVEFSLKKGRRSVSLMSVKTPDEVEAVCKMDHLNLRWCTTPVQIRFVLNRKPPPTGQAA